MFFFTIIYAHKIEVPQQERIMILQIIVYSIHKWCTANNPDFSEKKSELSYGEQSESQRVNLTQCSYSKLQKQN